MTLNLPSVNYFIYSELPGYGVLMIRFLTILCKICKSFSVPWLWYFPALRSGTCLNPGILWCIKYHFSFVQYFVFLFITFTLHFSFTIIIIYSIRYIFPLQYILYCNMCNTVLFTVLY